jgi:nucleotide-binding universal stress UspA family protein
MTGSYIAAHDGTERGADAVALARVLAHAHGAPVRIVHVCPPRFRRGVVDREHDPVRAERAQAVAVADPLRAPGDPLAMNVHADSPGHGLHDVAERERAALIVVGSPRGGPVGRTTAGATAQQLLHGAPCPIAIAPDGYASRAGRLGVIGVAMGEDPESREALRHAIDLAWWPGASVAILTAVDLEAQARALGIAEVGDDARHAARMQAEELLREARRAVPRGLAVETRVLCGDPGPAIVEACELGIDLLVCGSGGYGPARVVLLGSVTSYVVAHAHCPVVVVPRMAAGELDGMPATAVRSHAGMGGVPRSVSQ